MATVGQFTVLPALPVAVADDPACLRRIPLGASTVTICAVPELLGATPELLWVTSLLVSRTDWAFLVRLDTVHVAWLAVGHVYWPVCIVVIPIAMPGALKHL